MILSYCFVISSYYRVIASPSFYIIILSFGHIMHAFCIVILSYHHIISSYHIYMILSSHRVITSSYCYLIILSHQHIISSCHIVLWHYHIIVLSHQHLMILSSYLIVIPLCMHIASPLLRRFSKICKMLKNHWFYCVFATKCWKTIAFIVFLLRNTHKIYLILQKRSSRHRCVSKIASPEARKSESTTALYKSIVVYLKWRRRRRYKISCSKT